MDIKRLLMYLITSLFYLAGLTGGVVPLSVES
jgi:hypothetical protein